MDSFSSRTHCLLSPNLLSAPASKPTAVQTGARRKGYSCELFSGGDDQKGHMQLCKLLRQRSPRCLPAPVLSALNSKGKEPRNPFSETSQLHLLAWGDSVGYLLYLASSPLCAVSPARLKTPLFCFLPLSWLRSSVPSQSPLGNFIKTSGSSPLHPHCWDSQNIFFLQWTGLCHFQFQVWIRHSIGPFEKRDPVLPLALWGGEGAVPGFCVPHLASPRLT